MRYNHRIMALAVASGVFAAPATAQSTAWQQLGRTEVEDVTGRTEVAVHSARLTDWGAHVLRSEYPTDRVTSDGRRWRTSYLTATVECPAGTITLLRTDYHAVSGAFVSVTDMKQLTVPASVIPPARAWRLLYEFACAYPSKRKGSEESGS